MLEKHQKLLADAVKQLVESKKIAKDYHKKFKAKDKEKYKFEIVSSEDIMKKIDTLLNMYLGKVDKRQGIVRSPEVNINQRLGTASWYINSRFGNQTSTENRLIGQFKIALKEALEKTNTFFNKD